MAAREKQGRQDDEERCGSGCHVGRRAGMCGAPQCSGHTIPPPARHSGPILSNPSDFPQRKPCRLRRGRRIAPGERWRVRLWHGRPKAREARVRFPHAAPGRRKNAMSSQGNGERHPWPGKCSGAPRPTAPRSGSRVSDARGDAPASARGGPGPWLRRWPRRAFPAVRSTPGGAAGWVAAAGRGGAGVKPRGDRAGGRRRGGPDHPAVLIPGQERPRPGCRPHPPVRMPGLPGATPGPRPASEGTPPGRGARKHGTLHRAGRPHTQEARG